MNDERVTVTNAAVHDSQPVGELLRESDREAVLWADSAYVGPFIAALLKGFAMLANICEKGTATRSLSREQKRANKEKAASVHASNTPLGASPSSAATASAASVSDDVASKRP